MRFKKHVIAGATAVLLGALVLSGCAGGTSGGSSASTGSLTIAKPDGAAVLATQINNPFITTGSGMSLGYDRMIYEPLALVNPVGKNETTPWLADKVEWNADYTQLTVHPRAGVKWSDGQDFTADDIIFTFTMIKNTPALDLAGLKLSSIAKDGDNVVLSFSESKFVKQGDVLQTAIVPEHQWKGIADPSKDAVKDAIGTGPYTVKSFSSQGVVLSARTDYWGGTVPVAELKYLEYNDNTGLLRALQTKEVDWAQIFITDYQTNYVDKDPQHNVFWGANVLSPDMIVVNTTKAPFNDVAFRKAVNMVIDRKAHAEKARSNAGPELTNVTGIPQPTGDQYIAPEYKDQNFTIDVDGAKKVLTDAGYTWKDGALMDPSGAPVSFTLQDPQGWNDYVTGIQLVATQVKNTLGADAKVATPDANTWFGNLSSGNFDAALHWSGSGSNPWHIYDDVMNGAYLQQASGGQVSDNFGRYDNPTATALLQKYASASDDATRTDTLNQIQKIFVEDVPAIPIGTHPTLGEYNTRSFVGWPSEDDQYATADPTAPSAVQVVMKLTPAK
ncbi:ABC transporter substrate-binding protein [Microbacterium laevaniformans]|uniref:ABC transporter substrate-binding protein n=1 Tax=Microbacterium laevaniformans TaxID=36807 RepID=A0A4S2CYP8_9MICO|nr:MULTISPECIES: ABC transporter substrate-binding protein [Microbacterium]AXA95191.1 ABC transporter substrate-binding protein [Microbacterium sp. PM5]TGY33721.1 ABC transporter substrate-binding protein [Microbacterium laevaniformans]